MNSVVGKTAFGAMAVALSVVLMIPTTLEWFVYVLPLAASFLTMLCVIELGNSWAFGVYAATALLTLLLLPNKEAAVMYAAFFGYYPIVKALLEKRRLPRVLEFLLKLAVFNAGVVLAYFLLTKALGLPFNAMMGVKDDSVWARYAIPIFLGVGNVVFLFMDVCLTLNVTLYLRRWQKPLRRMLRFK